MQQIGYILITAVLSSLVTFFITSVTQQKALKTTAQEAAKTVIDSHVMECETTHEVKHIKNALIFIVTKMGGQPSDLGLL